MTKDSQNNFEEFKKLSQQIFSFLPLNENSDIKTRRYGPKILTTCTVDKEFYCEIKIGADTDPHQYESTIHFENLGEWKTKLEYTSYQNISKNQLFVITFFEEAIETYNTQKYILHL
jgi:hypothetical protein